MRVGIISPYSLTIPGGVQGQVLGLGRTLRRQGIDARVLGPCDGPPPDASVTPLGMSVPTAANGSIAPLAPDPSAQLRTMRALRDEAFDVIHLHEPLAPGPTQTAMFTKPAPIIATFHAAGGSAAYDWLGPGVRWLAKRIDLRVAVSEDARAMAVDGLGGEYEVLFNGVETDRYRSVDPWPTDEPTLFFCGRHEPRKGLALLLDAFTRLDGPVRLWIASDGPETPVLQSRVAGDPRIEWLGRVSEEEKLARLRGADVFCAPSLHGESFGVVLLEAMAAETAIVASDLHGYAQVARSGVDALLPPSGDVDALEKALRQVLDDPGVAERLIASGRDRAEEFSMDTLARRYVELYDRLIGVAAPR